DADIIFLKANILIQQERFEDAIEMLQNALDILEEKDDMYYGLGLAYQEWGKMDIAIEFFRKAIEENQQHEEALYDLAFCLDYTGKLEDSLSFYEKFINQDPYSYFAWYNMGIVYFKLGNYEK